MFFFKRAFILSSKKYHYKQSYNVLLKCHKLTVFLMRFQKLRYLGRFQNKLSGRSANDYYTKMTNEQLKTIPYI